MYQIGTVVHDRINQLNVPNVPAWFEVLQGQREAISNRSGISTGNNIAPPTPFEPFCMIIGKQTVVHDGEDWS